MRVKSPQSKQTMLGSSLASLGSMQIRLRKPDFKSGEVSTQSLYKILFSKPSTGIEQPFEVNSPSKTLFSNTKHTQQTSAFRLQERVHDTVSRGIETYLSQLPPEKRLSNPVPLCVNVTAGLNKSRSEFVYDNASPLNFDPPTLNTRQEHSDEKMNMTSRLKKPTTQYIMQQLQIANQKSTLEDLTLQRLEGDLCVIFPKQSANNPNLHATISLSGVKGDKTRANFEDFSGFETVKKDDRRQTDINEKRTSNLISSPRINRNEENNPSFKEITLKVVNQQKPKKVMFQMDKIQVIEWQPQFF